jgi:hypothetical protein
MDTEGHLVGRVYIKTDHAQLDTPVAVFQTSRARTSKPREALRVEEPKSPTPMRPCCIAKACDAFMFRDRAFFR